MIGAASAERAAPATSASGMGVLLPLVLAQFVCSFAASSMNVAISPIAIELDTTVQGVQSAITIFTLTMAALMIPASKLSDIWGRKRCFLLGLVVYGAGALVAAASPGIGFLILGYSILEGVGTALLIPPVYIFATVLFSGVEGRARSFGAVNAAAGVGASAGPLIGGIITGTTSWRVTFLVQALIVLGVIILGRKIQDAGVTGRVPKFDLLGAILSGAGLFLFVVGILATGNYGWGLTASQDVVIGETVVIQEGGPSPVWILLVTSLVVLGLFLWHIRRAERAGKDPLLAPHILQSRNANLGLVTQNMQWLSLLGMSFVISVFVQTVLHYGPIETGLILTPATLGILVASLASARLAKRFPQIPIIRGGFATTIAGFLLLLLLGSARGEILAFVPGLVLIGLGVGAMLTSSVNVVQSAFPAKDQGEISGLSRAVSNLGSSLGVAIAGSVVVSSAFTGNQGYIAATLVLAAFAGVGLIAALLLRPSPEPATSPEGSVSPAT